MANKSRGGTDTTTQSIDAPDTATESERLAKWMAEVAAMPADPQGAAENAEANLKLGILCGNAAPVPTGGVGSIGYWPAMPAATPTPAAVEPAKATAKESTSSRIGRLPKSERTLKLTALRAAIQQNPALVAEPALLARDIGVSDDTAARWIKADQQRHRANVARRTDPDDRPIPTR